MLCCSMFRGLSHVFRHEVWIGAKASSWKALVKQSARMSVLPQIHDILKLVQYCFWLLRCIVSHGNRHKTHTSWGSRMVGDRRIPTLYVNEPKPECTSSSSLSLGLRPWGMPVQKWTKDVLIGGWPISETASHTSQQRISMLRLRQAPTVGPRHWKRRPRRDTALVGPITPKAECNYRL